MNTRELVTRFVSTVINIFYILSMSEGRPLQSYANVGPYNSMQHEKHLLDWISDNLEAYFNMHCMSYWRQGR